MSFLKTINTVLTIANDLKLGYSIGQLIQLDRASAMQILEEVVQDLTPRQLDEFEYNFFNASMGMFTPAQRIRAMELYAYLKYLETMHYQQWRGFSATTEANALS
jgi:hypothetical protein